MALIRAHASFIKATPSKIKRAYTRLTPLHLNDMINIADNVGLSLNWVAYGHFDEFVRVNFL
jgi:hypothetical protein